MSVLALSRRGTIRGRLTLGFAALIVLLLVTGVLARRTMTQMSVAIDATLQGVQEEARQSAELSADVTQTIEAANGYVETRDTTALVAFRTHGWHAHEVQRAMNARLSRASERTERKDEEAGLIAEIDSRFSDLEVRYALAHRLVDEAGVAAIAFHPRHASQQHAGQPDYGLARELAEQLTVPVVLSGGLSDDDRAANAFEQSGATALMLARGSLGNPWRFGRLLGRYSGEPTTDEVAEELNTIIEQAEDHLGPDRASRYLRKFYPWYADTMGLTKREREALVTAPTTAHARAATSALTGRKILLAA